MQLLTRKSIAKFLDVSVGTIDNFRRRGDLPSIKVGKSVRFSTQAIQQLLGSRADSIVSDTPHNEAVIAAIIQPAILRVVRRTRGLSQADVAEKVGIPVRRLRRIETGATRPRPGEVEKLYALLSPTGERLS